MGGVYRIQTFLDFYIFFYIYKAPNMYVFEGDLHLKVACSLRE